MEVTGYRPNFRSNFSTLELMETDFNTFGKRIGSDPAVNVDNAKPGDVLATELMQDLYNRETTVFNELQDFRNVLNQWCIDNSNAYGRGDIPQFNPNINWYNYPGTGITAAGRGATFSLLREMIEAEKRFVVFYDRAEVHYKTIQSYLKEWSKNRPYASSIQSVRAHMEYFTSYGWYIQSVSQPVKAYLESGGGGDKKWITVEDLDKIPPGETCEIFITCGSNSGNWYGRFRMFIYTTAIENDSTVIWDIIIESGDKIRERQTNYANKTAKHFDKDHPDFRWLRDRVLNV